MVIREIGRNDETIARNEAGKLLECPWTVQIGFATAQRL